MLFRRSQPFRGDVDRTIQFFFEKGNDLRDLFSAQAQRLKATGAKEVIVLHIQDDRVMKLRPREQPAEFDFGRFFDLEIERPKTYVMGLFR